MNEFTTEAQASRLFQQTLECLRSETKNPEHRVGTNASTFWVDVLFVEADLLEHDSIFTLRDDTRQYAEVDK